MTTITPQKLEARIEQGEKLHLLVVHSPPEHAEIHVPGVQLIPLDQLDAAQLAGIHGIAKDQPVFVLTRSGSRAKQAVQNLENGGLSQCQVVEGGITDSCAMGMLMSKLPWNQQGNTSFCVK